MTTPQEKRQRRAWERLATWEKAAHWRVNAPEVAGELMALARQEAEHLMKLEREEALHRHTMDLRVWLSGLIGLLGGLACIAGLIAMAWHYADTGNVVPGLAVFGLGTGLTAGVYGVSHGINKRASSRPVERRAEAQHPS